MSLSLVKTGAVAAVLLLATTAASQAATWGTINYDSNVRYDHSPVSIVINGVDAGDSVKVIGSWGNWYKIQIPGPDGWVKKSAVDLDYMPGPGPSGPGVNACFWGPVGYMCING